MLTRRPPIILASTSRYRAAAMRRLALPFEVLAPPYEEEHHLVLGSAALVAHLSRRKAESVRDLRPDAIVIGSDQAPFLGERMLFKPETAVAAEAQLAELAGRTHVLLTGLCVIGPDGQRCESVEAHRLTMRPLSGELIAHYVAYDQPLDCAGSYRIEGLGVTLFERIQGEDPSAIEGLPLLALNRALIALGWDPLALPPAVE